MLERRKMDRDAIEIVGIDSLVFQEHLLRKIDAAVNFERLYEMVEPLYCEDDGRPSIAPVVLFKMVLVQHAFLLCQLLCRRKCVLVLYREHFIVHLRIQHIRHKTGANTLNLMGTASSFRKNRRILRLHMNNFHQRSVAD